MEAASAIRANPFPLASLASGMEATLAQSARMVAAHVAASLPDADTLLASLPAGALEGSPDNYTRHLVYADPFERFSVMVLVWRPGQHSPVHGHRTWCAYRVLHGTLAERHYRWNPESRTAAQVGAVTREVGDTPWATTATAWPCRCISMAWTRTASPPA